MRENKISQRLAGENIVITKQEKAKVFEEHSKLVYYVYYHKISSFLKRKYYRELDEAMQEGKLGLLEAIQRWDNSTAGYDSSTFATYAMRYIYGHFMAFYLLKTHSFKMSQHDYSEKYVRDTSRVLDYSFSLNQQVKADDDESTELSNFFGVTVDNHDGIFYSELEKFLKLMPDDEQHIMRYYYHTSIQFYDPNEQHYVKLRTAKYFKISLTKVQKITSKWNDELYELLHTERKGSLQDFHQHFEIEQAQKLEEQKREKQVLMTKNGELLHVRESLVDKFFEEGWQETQVLKSEESSKYWINNGEIQFLVCAEDVPKFESIGFVCGRCKTGTVKLKRGRAIKISNGERIAQAYESNLKYWEQIGYYCISNQIRQEKLVTIWKNNATTRISKSKLQQYLSDGWQLGEATIIMCSIDGEVREIPKVEQEKYLSENWIFLLDRRDKREKKSGKVLISRDGLMEAYIDESKLNLFLSHGWKQGTALMRVYVPNAKNHSSKYARLSVKSAKKNNRHKRLLPSCR